MKRGSTGRASPIGCPSRRCQGPPKAGRTILQEGITWALPRLKEGEKACDQRVDAVTGVIGQIFPGSKVDIYASLRAVRTRAMSRRGTVRCCL